MITALALVLLSASDPLPWINDDWQKAMAQAKAEKKLVAVDVWATWCHSCLSMKNYVLKEAPLAKVAKQHVWLALDYDLEKNAAFFGKYPVNVFPTFMVVDPEKEQVVARWAGTGTADEMTRFFASATKGASDAYTLGSRALAAGDYAKAREILERGLAEKNLDKTKQTLIAGALVETLWKLDTKVCAEKALTLIDKLDDSIPGLGSMSLLPICAEALPAEQRKPIYIKIRDRLIAAIESDQFATWAADDRSGVFLSAIDAEDALGNTAAADKLTERRLALLEDAALKAPDAKTRSTFDAHRLECYLRLKRYEPAQKMLEESVRAAPKDFNPPWRLAVLAKAKKDIPAGLKYIDRALALGYGPRKTRLYSTKIDLLIAGKRWSEARETIAQARAAIAKMDPKMVRSSWIETLDKQAKQITEQERAAS